MPEYLTRRALLVRGAGLAIGGAALALVRPIQALAQELPRGEDLVESGEAFRGGTADGVAVAAEAGGPVLRATGDGGVYTSGVLRSRARFTHVGLHWSAETDGGEPPEESLRFELRTSADGSSWSAWTLVRLQRRPDESPAGEYFGNLVYVGAARLVQYRATLRAIGGTGPSLRRVVATVIDAPADEVSASGNRLPTVTVSAPEAGLSLALTAREQWGADESYRFDGGRDLWAPQFVPTKKVIVHHTATRNDYATASQAAAEVRAIYYYHAVTQQWGDIGYHAVVDKFGNIYEGRHGRGRGAGRERLSAGVVAGHATAHNYGTAGVALLGNATLSSWPMPRASGPMWETLVRYCAFEAGRHFLRPLRPGASTHARPADAAASEFLRSDDLWTHALPSVAGHREATATACPGDAVMALLPTLRGAIHARLAELGRTAISLGSTPAGREVAVGNRLTFTWAATAPPSGWTLVGYEYCVEGWRKPRGSFDVRYLSGYTAEAQPRPRWTRVGPRITRAAFTPTSAGHYTFHARAVLRHASSGAERRGAYEANHTYLVR